MRQSPPSVLYVSTPPPPPPSLYRPSHSIVRSLSLQLGLFGERSLGREQSPQVQNVVFFPEFSRHTLTVYKKHMMEDWSDGFTINNGNRTEWSLIQSVIIRVINKIERPRRGSPILINHLYDYRPNWTPLAPITIMNCILLNAITTDHLSLLKYTI